MQLIYLFTTGGESLLYRYLNLHFLLIVKKNKSHEKTKAMKTQKILTLTFLTLALVATCILNGCSEEYPVKSDNNLKSITENENNDLTGPNDVNNLSGEISPEEVEELIFLREEEKLAHDVYDALSKSYSLPIFKNISNSELVHMDKVLDLLIHYNIDDPASEEPGVFTNPDIQEFYNSLIALGTPSIEGAMTAGATIEDYDIHDINHFIEQTDKADIITTLECLVCGSGNHMRSFSMQLSKRGIEYTPQFITPEEYNEIIAAGHQFCGPR